MDRVNRGALVPQYPYHGPVPSAVDPNSINSLYPSQSWQYHSPLEAEKRGSVIMGQAPTLPQPAAKRKGGRKPKDDPVSLYSQIFLEPCSEVPAPAIRLLVNS